MIDLRLGDCFDVMQSMADNSIDLVLTDPPYGLKFMGKKWDYDVPSVEVWAEALRVLKPGGHLLAFAGTRTQHRMACRIEDAGFEIRDMLAWVYGSGFPKSLDVSKAIDKAAGAEREVVGERDTYTGSNKDANTFMASPRMMAVTAPATDAAREWDGWGTALKPALEPITMARKPLVGTVAANVLEYGTGGLNIDACRVGDDLRSNPSAGNVGGGNSLNMSVAGMPRGVPAKDTIGRWPANLIHDGSDDVANVLGRASGFFYVAKASKKERDGSIHPTMKPIALMEYLVKLASSEGQTILDPFMGSGTTGIACQNLGREFIGIEMNEEYFEIAKTRINNAASEVLF